MAGRASYQMATRNTAAAGKAFEATRASDIRKRRTCTMPTACVCCSSSPTEAIDEFKKELELQPGHPAVADADRLRVPETRRRRGTALPWAQAGGGGGAEGFRRAQGARPGAARDRRRHRCDRGAPGWYSARARRVRACTSRSPRPIRRPAASRRPTRSATSSRGWTAWRAKRSRGAQSVGGIGRGLGRKAVKRVTFQLALAVIVSAIACGPRPAASSANARKARCRAASAPSSSTSSCATRRANRSAI